MSGPKSTFDDATGRTEFFAALDSDAEGLLDPETGLVRSSLVERVACPLCGSTEDHESIFVKQGFSFERCGECSLVHINPRLKPEEYLGLYQGKEASPYHLWTKVLTSPANLAWQIPYFDVALDIVEEHAGGKRLLDIGCSTGLFMERAAKRGFHCRGLELEPEAGSIARAKGFDVRELLLEDEGSPPGSFDVISFFGVVEHLLDPVTELRRANRLLSDDGIIVAIVPNVTSLAAMVQGSTARMFSGRNHLTYFSESTFARLFESTGFEVLHSDTVLTALDAVLNAAQFLDASAGARTELLPAALRSMVDDPSGRVKIEQTVCDLGLGLRLRVVARKNPVNG